MTTDPYPLRPVTDAEFAPWCRMIADTYGQDLTESDLAIKRAATDLDRTIAAFDGPDPVGGVSIYPRELTVPGGPIPVAGIAFVGVAPTHRRRGILTSMMRRQLADLHEHGAEPVAALRPLEAGIYGRYGYGPASRGVALRIDKRAMVFRPGVDFGTGTVRLRDTDAARPTMMELYDRRRRDAVGFSDRDGTAWDLRLFDPPGHGDGTAMRVAVHTGPDGTATGYALYRRRTDTDGSRGIQLLELVTLTLPAYATLWRFLAGFDITDWIDYEAAVDETLAHLLINPRPKSAYTQDRLWLRLVDVDRALTERRYAATLDTVLEVTDPLCPWNNGRWRLTADTDGASCEPTTLPAELRLSATELGAVHLGGTRLTELGAAGLVTQLRDGAVARADAAFRGHREPFHPGGWSFPLY